MSSEDDCPHEWTIDEDDLPPETELNVRIRKLNHQYKSLAQISCILESEHKDQRIRELKDQGESSQVISDILKKEHFGLCRTAVSNHLMEMRLDPRNKIRANFKCKGGIPKTKQRWYKVMSKLKQEVADYTIRMGFKPSVRTMFYQFVDEKIVKENEYNIFNDKATNARIGYTDQEGELSLPKLPIDCFVDDSRKIAGNYNDSSPNSVVQPDEIEDPVEYIERHIRWLKRAPKNYDGVGERGSDGVIGGYWYGQPEYVETWEEKNDLLPGFETILEDRYIRIRANKGYPSTAFLYKCTEELKEIIERKGLDAHDVTILYFGDWDPSGENIIYYIQRRLKYLGLEGVNFVPVAVTPEQIDEYNLPLLPVEQGEDKKTPNPNMREFLRLHGPKATHLNAFFTKEHFEDFKQIVLDAVDEHWDESIYDQMVLDYDVEADEPERYSNEVLKEKRKMMRDKITEAFKSGWEEDEEKTDEYEEEEEDEEDE